MLELTQWRGDEEMRRFVAEPAGRKRWPTSVPDVLFYLILVADSAGIDLVEAARRKLAQRRPLPRG